MVNKICKNVRIGENAKIGEYALIGVPPRGKEEGDLETVIGKNANIRSHSVIYAGNKIGDNFQTGHAVLVRELNEIGNDVSIGTHSVIEHNVKIGDGVRIHSQAFIPEFSELKKGCWIGPKVTFTNAYHPLCPKVKECLKGPVIGECAKVGATAVILPHVKIGKNAFVGAGAIVTSDVPDDMVVAGNPARVMKKVSELKCHSGLREKPYD